MIPDRSDPCRHLVRRGGRAWRDVARCALLAGLAVTGWTLAPSCGGEPAEPGPPKPSVRPAPGDLLLVVDGVEVRFADVAPLVAWLDRLLPEYSERAKIQKVLSTHTLPLLFARRDFAAERQQQRELARTVRAGCGNAVELETRTIERPRERVWVVPSEVDDAIAAFLFDPLQLGACSEPIEVPKGFVVAAAMDLVQGSQPARDRCDALLVAFPTHTEERWRAWLSGLHARIADRVTFVHPDYLLAIPPWLRLP